MSNNLISVMNDRKKIAKRQDVVCPACGEKQFSIFDKLYTVAFNKCYDCLPDDINAGNIMEISQDI